MIYAIPHSRNCVANHFMKAKKFAFLNEDNLLIEDIVSPSAGGDSSCSDKKETITLIENMKTDAVIVHNIGERALGKLLKSGIRVFRVEQQTPVTAATSSSMTELTESSQGRPSNNHLKKGGCSGHSGSCSGHSGGCGHHLGETTRGHKKRGKMNAISSLSPLHKK